MSNIVKLLKPDVARFIDDFAALQVPWGMQHATGRLYGYLLLSDAPVGLDDLAAALGVAKSSVSVATRMLEQAGLVRRHGEQGSKRVRYAAAEDAAGLLAAKAALLGAVARMLLAEVPASAPASVRQRLDRHARFYLEMRGSIEQRLGNFDADTAAAQS